MVSHRKKQQKKLERAPPPKNGTATKSFQCHLPTVEPNLPRIQDPLPFAPTVQENLALATAFIDQSAHLTKHFQEQYELMERRFHAAIDTVGLQTIELHLLRDQLAAATLKVGQLEATVTHQDYANRALEQRLEKSRADAAIKEAGLTSKLHASEKALNKAQKGEQRLKNNLDKVLREEHEMWVREMEHEIEDHNALDAAQKALEKEIKEKTDLQAQLDQKIKQLVSTTSELETTTERLRQCKKKCEDAQQEIKTLKDQLASRERDNARLNADLDALDAKAKTQEQELADSQSKLADLTKELDEAKKRITEKDGAISGLEDRTRVLEQDVANKVKALEDLKNTSEETIKQLQGNIEELAAHDKDDEEKLRAAEEAKKLSDATINELKAKVDEAKLHDEEDHKRLETEEEARRAVEAQLQAAQGELDRLKSRPLQNNVVLENPIAIAGSLSGAPRNVDDEFFSFDCPFAVTLWNHSSTKIFVSSNGALSLDVGVRKFNWQDGLVEANREVNYALYPFWADLFIYAGTPQGIYYEVSGSAPNRALTVEWYVSRYGSSDQYYHFSVRMEEARPNYTLFRFYEALDKGSGCTVGVMGPPGSFIKEFSKAEAKIVPGVQVEFDTAAGTMTPGTFPAPGSPPPQAVLSSVGVAA